MRLTAALLAAVLSCAPARVQAPGRADLTSTRELSGDEQIAQALDRLAFGGRPGDIAAVRAVGVDGWIARQLDKPTTRDEAAERAMASFPTLRLSAEELARRNPPPSFSRRRRGDSTPPSPADSVERRRAARAASRVVADVAAAKIARALVSERQLEETMVDFWENHFSVFAGKGAVRYYLVEYDRDVIRPHALGHFRDLLGAVAKSPAMLFYLDNWQSAANRGLNENYARELLELHTLGVDGGYTQADVIAVARALTGWSIAQPRRGGGFVFRPQWHDDGEKIVLGHRLPPGRGAEDGELVLDILARHPATAHYLATKLVRRFVSDTPSPTLVERAAATFTRTDGDIREVVRTIVSAPEFFSRAAYRSKVKTPFELVVSTLRALGAEPDTSPRTARIVARLGQPIFGHQAPNGYPETGDAWMNAGAILNRINFGMAAAAGRLPGARADGWPGAAALRSTDRAAQVDGVVAAFLHGDVSPETRAVLVAGENPLARPSAESDREDVGQLPPSGLTQIVGLALGSPEFQRR
jgi:uncharacterized protein (DUF1800 family)